MHADDLLLPFVIGGGPENNNELSTPGKYFHYHFKKDSKLTAKYEPNRERGLVKNKLQKLFRQQKMKY